MQLYYEQIGICGWIAGNSGYKEIIRVETRFSTMLLYKLAGAHTHEDWLK